MEDVAGIPLLSVEEIDLDLAVRTILKQIKDWIDEKDYSEIRSKARSLEGTIKTNIDSIADSREKTEALLKSLIFNLQRCLQPKIMDLLAEFIARHGGIYALRRFIEAIQNIERQDDESGELAVFRTYRMVPSLLLMNLRAVRGAFNKMLTRLQNDAEYALEVLDLRYRRVAESGNHLIEYKRCEGEIMTIESNIESIVKNPQRLSSFLRKLAFASRGVQEGVLDIIGTHKTHDCDGKQLLQICLAEMEKIKIAETGRTPEQQEGIDFVIKDIREMINSTTQGA